MLFIESLHATAKLEKLRAATAREVESMDRASARLAELRNAYAADCADAAERGEVMPSRPAELGTVETDLAAREATVGVLRSRLPDAEAAAAAEQRADLERRRREVVAPIGKKYATARGKFESALEDFLGVGGLTAWQHAKLALNYAAVGGDIPIPSLLGAAGLDVGEGGHLSDHVVMPGMEEMHREGLARGARADAKLAALVAE